MTVIVFIIAFSLLVLIHEWGHFISARLLGIPVEEFGIGFPPRLAAFQRGETVYTINGIPLGGFVRLKGESGRTDDLHDFSHQNKRRRALVIGAGVLMNALLAYLLTVILLVSGLPQDLSHLPSQASVHNAHIDIVGILPNAPAQSAGMTPGSTIVSIDGTRTASVEEIQNTIHSHAHQPVAIETQDAHGSHHYTVMPTELAVNPPVVGIGVQLEAMGIVSYRLFPALGYSGKIIGSEAITIVTSLAGLVRDLFIAHRFPENIAGPIGIAVLVGQASRTGWQSLLSLLSVLSLNLAVLNVLPIPALDGGRLAFLIAEVALRRRVRVRIESIIHQVGFALLLVLILLITLHDIRTLFL